MLSLPPYLAPSLPPIQAEEKVRQDREKREAGERKKRVEQAHREWVAAAVARERERRETARKTAVEKTAKERKVGLWQSIQMKCFSSQNKPA